MIEGQRKISLGTDLTLDIYTEGEKRNVIFRYKDNKVGEMSWEHFFSLFFIFGNEKEQDDIMPQRQTTVTQIYKQHRIKTVKDVKAGENIVVNCTLEVPTMIYDALKLEMK